MFSPRCAQQPDRIDAEMMAEAAVLDRDEGVGHIGGKFGDRNERALRETAPGDLPSVVVEQRDVVRRTFVEQSRRVGKLRDPAIIRDRAENGAPGEQQHDHIRPGAPRLRFGRRRAVSVTLACLGWRSSRRSHAGGDLLSTLCRMGFRPESLTGVKHRSFRGVSEWDGRACRSVQVVRVQAVNSAETPGLRLGVIRGMSGNVFWPLGTLALDPDQCEREAVHVTLPKMEAANAAQGQ